MYVEICGAPCAGKSTLRVALGENVLAGPALRAAPPAVEAAWLREVVSDRCDLADWRRHARTAICRAGHYATFSGGRPALDDHGPLQRGHWLFMLLGDGLKPFDIYMATLPLPDLAVFCDAPFGVLAARNKTRSAETAKPDHAGTLASARAATFAVRRAVRARGGRTLDLDMTRPVADNAARLLAALDETAAA